MAAFAMLIKSSATLARVSTVPRCLSTQVGGAVGKRRAFEELLSQAKSDALVGGGEARIAKQVWCLLNLNKMICVFLAPKRKADCARALGSSP